MGTVTDLHQWSEQRKALQRLDTAFIPGLAMGAKLAYLRADHATTLADVEAEHKARKLTVIIGMAMTLGILFLLMYACRAGGIT